MAEKRRFWAPSEATVGGPISSPTVRAVLAIGLVALLAALVTPPGDGTVRPLTVDDIDRVADRAIVATHDFEFERPDPHGVRTVRETAAAQVVPVWDYDASLQDVIDERISSAFGSVRDALATEGQRVATELAEADSDDEPEEAEGSADAPRQRTAAELLELVPEERRIELATQNPALASLLSGARDPAAFQIEPFAHVGFTRESEDALKNLVREAMVKHVVEDATALENVGGSGVTLRTFRNGSPTGERRVRQFLSFGDLRRLDEIMAPARHHLFYIESQPLRDAIARAAETLVVANTRLNEAETRARIEAAMDSAEQEFRATLLARYRQGEILVQRGEVIDDSKVQVVEAMLDNAPPRRSPLQSLLGSSVVIVLLVFPVLLFSLGNLRRFTHDTKDLGMMFAVLVAQLGASRVGIFLSDLVGAEGSIPTTALYFLLPFASGAMLVRILTNAENSLVYTILYALLAGILFRFDVTFVTAAIVASIVGTVAVRDARTRTDILRAGGVVGFVSAGLAVALVLVRSGDFATDTLYVAAGGALSGITSALFVYALLPIIESVFRYTTPMRLMELANLNHPALKELILKAPGSYHHSMMVGQLVEAACEAVGADALLGRVGSYFHDIGKVKNPQYFAENQQGSNPHDKLRPNMSALVIKAHVKDGVEMARQYKLPAEIIAFIREHHGTSLIAYFFHRAQQESDDTVNESDYRYPGPKPQSRETAICMLADGIEAASRSLPDPSHAHLKGLVQKMINKAFIDGQLDECELTLKDLDRIAQAILLRLTAFYHHRPEYPDGRRSQAMRRVRGLGETGVSRAVEAGSAAGDDGAPGDDADPEPRDESAASQSVDLNLRRLGM